MSEKLFIPPIITYPVLRGFVDDPLSKYRGLAQNPQESQRRLAQLSKIQLHSDSVCYELNIETVKLIAKGSAQAGYAQPNSNFDIRIEIAETHPLITKPELRKAYTNKMHFLLLYTHSIDFDVNIFFVII
jgi:hypothetical protein